MATITLRSVKGTPLTVAEVDANFSNLNSGKLETTNNLSDLTNTTTARTNLGVAIGTNVQAYDADLSAIAALTGTTGLLKKTAADTWSLDTTAYGTVASVALSLPDIFSVTGSPITTTGTLTATLASQTAKYVFAAPNGTAGSPSFRLLLPSDVSGLAASATTDTTNAANISSGTIPSARLATGTANSTTYLRGDQTWVTLAASATSDTTNAANISSGTLVVARGGTGTSTTPTQGGVIYAASAAGYASTSAGTAGQALTSGGAGAPSWITLAASATLDTTNANNITSGTLAIVRGGTGGSATPTAGTIAYGNGTAYVFSTAGTSGDLLTSGGSGAPTWTGSTSTNTANAVVKRDGNGDFTARVITATDFNSTSDQTLKQNITTIADPVSTIRQLNGVEFNWKINDEKSAGVIAQQLETILPHLVKVEPTTGIKGVNYSGLIGYLIESIKDLDSRLSDLEHK